MFEHRGRVAALSATIFALLITAAPASGSSSTFYLDTHNSSNQSLAFCSANLGGLDTPPGCGSVTTAPVIFLTGQTYSATVAGAVSAWGGWPYRKCGKIAPSSEFGSPSVTNTPAGDDAQFRFALPLDTGKCAKLPKKAPYFQVNLGGGWFHPVAVGDPSKPSKDNTKTNEQHPYTFTFTGKGVAPQFRFVDYHSSDNSGRFRITVTGP